MDNKTLPQLSTLEQLIIKHAYEMKEHFSKKGLGNHFYLEFNLSGRVDGVLKYDCRLRNEGYSDNSVDVKGNSLKQVVTEFERRFGYETEAQTLLLPNVPDATFKEEKLFSDVA